MRLVSENSETGGTGRTGMTDRHTRKKDRDKPGVACTTKKKIKLSDLCVLGELKIAVAAVTPAWQPALCAEVSKAT